jgi:ATP phosphoribosyltransferase
MIKIIVPANMGSTLELMALSGRTVVFPEGEDFTTIEETREEVVRLRSFDIPVGVEGFFDVGFCGSDWVEEKKLELGLRHVNLGGFNFGRSLKGPQPKLDLITLEGSDIKKTSDLKEGSIVVTEYPLLTEKFLNEKGVKTSRYGKQNGAPTQPQEYKRWCQKEGVVGITTVHGRIAALVRVSGEVGVMINESGDTLRRNGLKKIENIMPITTQLIANINSFEDEEKRNELDEFDRRLDEAYQIIVSREPEEGTERRSIGRERFT